MRPAECKRLGGGMKHEAPVICEAPAKVCETRSHYASGCGWPWGNFVWGFRQFRLFVSFRLEISWPTMVHMCHCQNLDSTQILGHGRQSIRDCIITDEEGSHKSDDHTFIPCFDHVTYDTSKILKGMRKPSMTYCQMNNAHLTGICASMISCCF